MKEKTKSTIKKASAGTVAALGAAAILAVSPISTGIDTPPAEENSAAYETSEVIETAENEKTDQNEDIEKEKIEKETEKSNETEAEKSDEPQTEADGHLTAEKDLSAYATEIGYSIVNDEYSAALSIDVPSEFSVDIAELYFNDCLVDTALLPKKSAFTSIPFVFDDLGKLKISFYRLGENIGAAVFKDGKLYTDLKGE